MRIIAAALIAALLGAAPATQSAGTADSQYESLAKAYYDVSFRLSPIEATAVGVHDYDDQIGDFSAAGVATQMKSDHDYLGKLATIDRANLSPSVALDATLLEYTLRDDLLLNETLAQWRHDPDDYTQSASAAVFTVMSKDYAPLEKRLGFAVARERLIPAMLAEGEKNITSVDAITQQISAEDAAGSVDFFKTSVPQAFEGVRDASLQAQLKKANDEAAGAMAGYARWIKTLKPNGTFAIGADAYRKRLLYEDALSMPLDQYLAVGERALAQTRAQFIATARKINPHATPLQVYLSITKIHPAPDALLSTAQRDLVRLRAFVEAKRIVTLPPNANIKVIETPPFERATTSAAEDSPGPLETVATQAYYYVTPVDPTWSAKEKEEFLAQFNDFEFPIISAHEVYPGHFTNFSIDRGLDLSLTRKLSQSSEFAEGWAHYSEQMMVDEGWGDGDPRVRLAQLDEALLRECRYVVGVKLHTAGMSLTQAEQLFTSRCFQTHQIAVEESLRGTQDPMYGYYTLGKLMILKLRADYKKKLGSAYTLEKFHDELLSRGDPPLPLLRPFILGASDDGQPL
ncbi:MAG TPA: DUF885 domain-containing protein [Candidatus Cybelea sp.]|nr:DUF885 domain-containing protein [Candidatus Cybelea sp.]